ncbi:MAG: membrane protein insertion efficiency factor YidD [Spirochaetales bacterium]|uniref:membrane protein insertion efficiency factor YidD n=1 Tax=Bullifex sp. TaxID=2815808 RepID=UPI002A58B147|nr:membrane protein insertion efficiency factor YidD [Bullifex sp.]MDD7271704.1 membrane protein insertion efficiency factor YidD [Spirochaetales bacterium]MDY4066607.1 membrane protein insertion efficiency factor YidD [Bullifex sp.]
MKKILTQIFLIPVYFYRLYLSPIMGHGKCRYIPTCSEYFVKAVEKHGIIKGTILGFARIGRCRKSFLGGVDNVPESFSFEQIKKDYIVFKKKD